MFEIFWIDSAVSDLVRLKKFLAANNPRAAHKAVTLIKNSTGKLKEFPLIGEPVEGLKEFYDLFIEFGAAGYHVRYKVISQKVYIIHIKHTKELEY